MSYSMERKLRIMTLGLRGFPGVQGGVETHAENLYPLITSYGCEVEAIVRARYMRDHMGMWRDISYVKLWSPRSPRLEAVVHSLLGVLVAAYKRPDILHIHAVGPALVTPLARLLGLKVVITHHGPDYKREKWGKIARQILRCGEAFGMRFSHRRIAISQEIRDLVWQAYREDMDVIPNGVRVEVPPSSTNTLTKFGLTPGKYVLSVGRLVPEKRQVDLLEAFAAANLTGWKVVLVGSADHHGPYVETLKACADRTPGAVLTGFQSGVALKELYANAGIFVLPSSHEGLPIAILEALSFGLRVLASDIPAHREMELPVDQYFSMGGIPELTGQLRRLSQDDWSIELRDRARAFVAQRYNWQSIARQTFDVYLTVSRQAGADLDQQCA